MSDSTSKLTQLTTAQAGKEATVNELFNAASQAMLFGRRQSSSGLSWDYFGGRVPIDGTATEIANGTVTLTASQTNYVEATRAGVVSANTTAFTAGSIALYKVVTGASTVTSYEDHRPWVRLGIGQLDKVLASDANATLTHAEAINDVLNITSSVSLTATRDVVLPLAEKWYFVYNGTTGGQSIRFIGASGTGITVANGVRTIIQADGTNVVEVAPATSAASLAATIVAATEKATPVDADLLALVDSADSNTLKKLTWANLKATIKAYYDAVASTLTNKTISLANNTLTGTMAEFNTACSDGEFAYITSGSWTPGLGDGTYSDATFTSRSGRYVTFLRADGTRLVYVSGIINCSSLGSIVGDLRIINMPYTTTQYSVGNIGTAANLNITAGQSLGIYVQNAVTYLTLKLWDNVGGNTNLTAAEFSNDGFIIFSAWIEA